MNTLSTPETDALEFYDAMHDPDRVVNSEFARALERERDELRRWTSVNGVLELERQLAETREQRDRLDDQLDHILLRLGRTQERMIDAERQRDRLAEALKECREDSVELLTERDWWQHEPRGDYQQRYQETLHNVTRADAALQSLTTNEPISK